MGSAVLTLLSDALKAVHRLGLDTVPLIYYVEEHPRYIDRMDEVFHRIDSGSIRGVTSVISLAEVLVHPLRSGRQDLHDRYKDLLLGSRHFETRPITAAIAESSAGLRSRYNLRTPDALQVATAMGAGCEAFLTNDLQLRRLTEIRILALDELEL
jgi:predicted nucleic acid-binding protein